MTEQSPPPKVLKQNLMPCGSLWVWAHIASVEAKIAMGTPWGRPRRLDPFHNDVMHAHAGPHSTLRLAHTVLVPRPGWA